MRYTRVSVIMVVVFGVAAFGACSSDGRYLREPRPDQTQSVYTPSTTTTIVGQVVPEIPAIETTPQLAFVLVMPWLNDGVIDARYTCTGGEVQPQFSWYGAPAGTVEMALVVSDVDASNFVHWIIAGLDPNDPLVAENEVPLGAIEGQNGFSTAAQTDVGWRGPCPPAGSSHTYRATLYALDQQVELPTGSPAADLLAVIEGSALQAAQVDGVYPTP